jgi:hypothetical protein
MMFRNNKMYLIVPLFFLFGVPVFGEEEISPQSTWEEYTVIVEKNIFSRNRWQQTERATTQARTSPARARTPESFFVLRGIARDDEGFIAFIEDTRAYKMSRIRVGEPVTEGKVKDMSLDHVDFELNGEARRIEIGMDLGGSAPQATTYTGSPSFDLPGGISPQGKDDSGKPASSKEETDDILKRLKERRQRELGE